MRKNSTFDTWRSRPRPARPLERAGTRCGVDKGGPDLLERHRDGDSDPGQAFYAGADKARERTHDAQVYRAYLRAAEGCRSARHAFSAWNSTANETREYQRFIQERNRGDGDSDGRSDRSPEQIEGWAHEHELPYFDDEVHFPDAHRVPGRRRLGPPRRY